jgi:hypothetical protein
MMNARWAAIGDTAQRGRSAEPNATVLRTARVFVGVHQLRS